MKHPFIDAEDRTMPTGKQLSELIGKYSIVWNDNSPNWVFEIQQNIKLIKEADYQTARSDIRLRCGKQWQPTSII